jgi:hypothetical protein
MLIIPLIALGATGFNNNSGMIKPAAISMAKIELEDGKDAQLKKMAQKIVDAK